MVATNKANCAYRNEIFQIIIVCHRYTDDLYPYFTNRFFLSNFQYVESRQDMNIDDKKGGAISETKVAEEEVTENSTQPKRKSFWTECDQCRIPFEYFDRYFLGHRFRCNGCRGIFVALEVDPPSTQRSRNTGK
ncbi:hypothetical protein ACFX14_023948 [Malus domestica]